MSSISQNFKAPQVSKSLLRNQASIRRQRLSWTRYLPFLMFLGFFLGNTLIPPRRLWLVGRWGVLFGIFALTLLTTRSRYIKRWPMASSLLTLSFFLLLFLLPYSQNVQVSAAKWGAFFVFLMFCGLFYSRINRREDALQVLRPLIVFFIVFVWATPLAALYFPQGGGLGHLRGLLTFTDALGGFLVFFGLPGILYKLETEHRDKRRLAVVATLLIAISLVFASASRTASFTMIFVLGIAFWRWRGLTSRSAFPIKILVLTIATLLVPGQSERVSAFIYKYPTATNLMGARASYWQRTTDAFRARPWTGAGFGVQERGDIGELSFNTSGNFQEQGSAYLGMLEEVGILGATPIFLILFIVGFKNARVLLWSKDPLKLLLARSIVAGLLWGGTENYLLYLGNAISILFFLSLFLKERLDQIDSYQRAAALRMKTLAMQLRRSGREVVGGVDVGASS